MCTSLLNAYYFVIKFLLDVSIAAMKCMAHLLQLAVKDFLDFMPKKYSNVIQDVREMLKNCRTSNVRNALRREKCNELSLDVKTRYVFVLIYFSISFLLSRCMKIL